MAEQPFSGGYGGPKSGQKPNSGSGSAYLKSSPLVGNQPSGVMPLERDLALNNQASGWNQLRLFLNGPGGGARSSGPFGSFIDAYLGPIATAALNAMQLGGGGVQAANPDELFNTIKQGLTGGVDIYSYLQKLGQQAMQAVLKANPNDYASLTDTLNMIQPLTTFGMGPVGRGIFGRQQEDALYNMEERGYLDPSGQMGAGYKDWGDYASKLPFFQQYYGFGGQGR